MKFYDAFCGVGGFHKGITQAHPDWECSGACDIDKYARIIYNKHFPKVNMDGDIRELERLPEGTELFCGGFPCQSFSIAGKRGGFEDTRGTLFFEIARLLRVSRPKWVFLENVKGLLNHDGGRTFGTILNTLGELGYWWEYQVLNSKDFGVPQNRERVFIIGHLAGGSSRPVFPIGEGGNRIDQPHQEEQGDGERIWCDGSSDTKVANALRQRDYKGGGNLIQLAVPHPCQSYRVYGTEGIAPTIPRGSVKSGNVTPMIMENKIQQINSPNHSADRVYSPEGIAPSLRARARSDKYASSKIIQKSQDWRERGELREYEKYSPTIRANMGDTAPMVVVNEIQSIVRVRKHEVNIRGLQSLLRGNKNISNKGIAERLGVPLTMVEHWFRTDDCFSIPEASIWPKLKELLGISTDEFDKQIMEFEEREGVFEKSNRAYGTEGLSPTLTGTTAGEKIFLPDQPKSIAWRTRTKQGQAGHFEVREDGISNAINTVTKDYGLFQNQKIRRLTEVECERLQGYPDGWTEGISATQRYKCLGNSVTVNVIRAIAERIEG